MYEQEFGFELIIDEGSVEMKAIVDCCERNNNKCCEASPGPGPGVSGHMVTRCPVVNSLSEYEQK